MHTSAVVVRAVVLGLVACGIPLSTAFSDQQTICARDEIRSRSGRFKLSRNLEAISGKSCPEGFSAIITIDVPQPVTVTPTPTATTTPNAPGSGDSSPSAEDLLFGDESAGDLVIDRNFTILDPNRQYRNVTVQSGATLTVPSGTVLRCTGNFLNNGNITVAPYAEGAYRYVVSQDSSNTVITQPAGTGIAKSAAASGMFGEVAGFLAGGQFSGNGMTAAEARTIYSRGVVGGGGGGGGACMPNLPGIKGGGAVTVLCKGTVVVSALGQIQANGETTAFSFTGAGGGAGGIVVLASNTAVMNFGVIEAKGGAGGASGDGLGNGGAGGGGGGGIIHFISKSVVKGTTVVTGGAAGFATIQKIGTVPRSAGGQGGSLAGNGGNGGSLRADGTRERADAGGDGFVFETLANPATLF